MRLISQVKDTVVLQFWRVEFAGWNERYVSEAIAPVLNKVGAFVANPVIRNIIGQPKSSFNIRQIMDEGKILIVNLSKGLIGEDNAAILGSFLVTKIQLAAMSRREENRRRSWPHRKPCSRSSRKGRRKSAQPHLWPPRYAGRPPVRLR